MVTHVFAYGSLLHPESLRRTLPDVDLNQVVCARLVGHIRTFDVAFPNDGSQPDKSYVDARGQRPPFVLFANVVPVDAGAAAAPEPKGPAELRAAATESWVAGVLIPLNSGDLDRLAARERRYDLRDVSAELAMHDGSPRPALAAATFVGLPRFTRPEHADRGVVPRNYLTAIEAGVAFWDTRLPGFAAAYRAGTRLPDAEALADLRRVDAEAAPTPAGFGTTQRPC